MPKKEVSFTLRETCVRSYSLALYKANARWRTTNDISRDLLIHLKRLKVPICVKKEIYAGINEIFAEVKRWGKSVFMHSNTF
jgi:hypothetical protein